MSKKIKNKSDVVQALSIQFPNLSKDLIRDFIDKMHYQIVESIALDGKVEIRGFGTYSKKYIRPRKFINPKTKELQYISETSTIHFKPSKSLIQD